MIENGTRVRTADRIDQRDYTPEGVAARRPGMEGTVLSHHTGHGLCFKVHHDDGTEGYYDEDELEGAGFFVAIQRGVYRHEIVGVASTLERAKELGQAAIKAEPDHYHAIEIVMRKLNESGPEVTVGTMTARRGPVTWGDDPAGYCGRRAELLGLDWSTDG